MPYTASWPILLGDVSVCLGEIHLMGGEVSFMSAYATRGIPEYVTSKGKTGFAGRGGLSFHTASIRLWGNETRWDSFGFSDFCRLSASAMHVERKDLVLYPVTE